MRISDLSSDGCSSDLTRESDPAVQVQPIAIRELAQAVEVDLLEQRRGVRIDLVRIDPDIPRHRGLVVAHAGDQVQQPQRLFRSLRTRGVEFERRVRHGDRLDQLGAVVEGVYQPRDAGPGIEFAAHEAEAAHRVPVERRHRAPSKPKPRACRRKRRHRKRSEEHTSELQSLMRNSYAVFRLNKKKKIYTIANDTLLDYHNVL